MTTFKQKKLANVKCATQNIVTTIVYFDHNLKYLVFSMWIHDGPNKCAGFFYWKKICAGECFDLLSGGNLYGQISGSLPPSSLVTCTENMLHAK